MSAQQHLILAKSALDLHQKNLLECVDALVHIKPRIDLLLEGMGDCDPEYFTLLSIQEEITRSTTKLYAEVAV